MKKIVIAISLIMVLTLSGCTFTKRVKERPSSNELPYQFIYVSDAGNGYFLYKSPVGYFLVSKQIQGTSFFEWDSDRFIDIVYIGKELNQ